MAIQRIDEDGTNTVQSLQGTHAERLAATLPANYSGTIFWETDTGIYFKWHIDTWIEL